MERLCGPNVISVEGDVLPAERRDMGKQIIADNLTLGTQLGHSATEINGVPEDFQTLCNQQVVGSCCLASREVLLFCVDQHMVGLVGR